MKDRNKMAKKGETRAVENTEKPKKEAEISHGAAGYLTPILVLLLAGGIQYATKAGLLNDYLNAAPAATKPFGDFESFYPFYLKEHSDQSTKRTHFVGTSLFLLLVLLSPSLILALVTAGVTGIALFPLFRANPSGLPEMAIMLGVYAIVGRSTTASWKRTLIPPIVAYAFAWFGHFYFEGNKPATFIYPTFSLMGDFHMLYDALQGMISKDRYRKRLFAGHTKCTKCIT